MTEDGKRSGDLFGKAKPERGRGMPTFPHSLFPPHLLLFQEHRLDRYRQRDTRWWHRQV
jgi:hypothetical protein